jgi:hypothetical protein
MMNDLRRHCRSRPTVITPVRKKFEWYSNWKKEVFACSHCGWQGLGSEAFPDEVGMMECPRCDHGVGYVEFPSLRDTEKAAALGNEDAIRDLPERRAWIKRLEARTRRFEREKLKNVSQLPDLDGESLEFTLDVVSMDGEDYQVIRLGDAEISRELAFWDHLPRFNDIKNLLRKKYGTRFKSLTPTAWSLDWLTGDHFHRSKELTCT